MTKAAAGVLLYLDRYLEANPTKRPALHALHLKHTGRELSAEQLWKHRHRKVEPGLSAALVYFIFLSAAGELKPAKNPADLFTYKNPNWLKK